MRVFKRVFVDGSWQIYPASPSDGMVATFQDYSTDCRVAEGIGQIPSPETTNEFSVPLSALGTAEAIWAPMSSSNTATMNISSGGLAPMLIPVNIFKPALISASVPGAMDPRPEKIS